MSVHSLAYAWDIKDLAPEERLTMLYIANAIGDLAYPYCPDWINLGDWIGSDRYRALEIVHRLIDRGLLLPQMADDGWSHVWIAYGGPYDEAVDWTAETKSRSKRVAALIERDGAECAYCDRTPASYEVDHFIPRAKGGPDIMANLVLACAPCNRKKRALHPKEFLKDDPRRYESISTNLLHLHA